MIKKVKDLSYSAVKLAYKVSSFKKLSCHCFVKVFEVVLGDWKKFGGLAVLEYKVRFWQLGDRAVYTGNQVQTWMVFLPTITWQNYLAKLPENYYLKQALGHWCQFAPIQELQSLISSIILMWKISNISSCKCKIFLGILLF